MNTPKRTDSKVRAEVRKRMAATGEKYTTALAAITNPPVELPPFLPSGGEFFVTDEEFGPDSLPLRITWGADRRAQILAAAAQSPTTAFIVTKRPAEYPTGVLAADEIPSAALLERMDAILLDGYAQIVDDPHRRLELESVLRHARAKNLLVAIYVDDDDRVPDGVVDRALARLALTGDFNSLVATSLSSELVLGVDAHGAQVGFAGHRFVLDPDAKLSPPPPDDFWGAWPERLTAAEAAEILRIRHKDTMYEHLRSGRVPAHRIGGAWVIFRDPLRSALKRSALEMIYPDEYWDQFPDPMNARELAEFIGLSYSATIRLLADGDPPSMRVGRQKLVSKADAVDFMIRHANRP